MDELLGEVVVLDTQGPMIFMGRLVRIAADCFVLEDADVHDRTEGHSNKELYVLNALKLGVRVNRRRTFVPRRHVVAVSTLRDVIPE